MARYRMIKPEYWEDYKVCKLSPYARLLFIAMWNFADDKGYLEYQPEWIKIKCLPYDDVDVRPLINEIAAVGRIEVRNDVIYIKYFTKHQRIDKSSESELKAIFEAESVEYHDCQAQNEVNSEKNTDRSWNDLGMIEERSKNGPRTIEERSRRLYISQVKLNKDKTSKDNIMVKSTRADVDRERPPDCNFKKKIEKKQEPRPPSKPNKPTALISHEIGTQEQAFERLWEKYPRREKRKGAWRHFMATVKTEADCEAISQAMSNYLTMIEGKERQYIQQGETWFNNWRDYVDVEEMPRTEQEKMRYEEAVNYVKELYEAWPDKLRGVYQHVKVAFLEQVNWREGELAQFKKALTSYEREFSGKESEKFIKSLEKFIREWRNYTDR